MSQQQDRERLLREQEAQQRRTTEHQTATQMAQSKALEGDYAAPGYWDIIGDPDIRRELGDDEHLDEFVKTEMSDKFALGNIQYGDWESWGWQIENEFWTMRNEFQDADSNLDDVDMAAMYGETRPKLNNERARRLRSAMQVKKMMTSLSINARGLRSGTEIHAVTKSESPDSEDSDGGMFSGLKSKLV